MQVEVVGFSATASFDETGISVRTLTKPGDSTYCVVRAVSSLLQDVDGHCRFDAYFIASLIVHVSVCVRIVCLSVPLGKSSG